MRKNNGNNNGDVAVLENLNETAAEVNGSAINELSLEGELAAMTTETATTPETAAATETTTPAGKKERKRRPAEPVSLALDVTSLNANVQSVFGGNLLSLMESDAVLAAGIPVFTLKYKPNQNSAKEVEQSFAVIMGEGYPEDFSVYDMLVAGSEVPDVEKLRTVMSSFKDVTISALHFLPLAKTTVTPDVNINLQLRGNKNDKEPFIVYTRPLCPVYASVIDGKLEWNAIGGVELSDYQKKVLTRWFSEELSKQITPELISNVLSGAAVKFLQRVMDVSGLRKQLDEIERLSKEFLLN